MIFFCLLCFLWFFLEFLLLCVVVWFSWWFVFWVMFGVGLIKLCGDVCWCDLICFVWYYEM